MLGQGQATVYNLQGITGAVGVRGKFIFLLFMLLPSCQPEESENDQIFEAAQTAVRKQLKDPGSAQFEDMQRCGSSRIVTGYMNAKNGFGGYVGREQFVFDGEAAIGGENAIPSSEIFISKLKKCTEVMQADLKKVIENSPTGSNR